MNGFVFERFFYNLVRIVREWKLNAERKKIGRYQRYLETKKKTRI